MDNQTPYTNSSWYCDPALNPDIPIFDTYEESLAYVSEVDKAYGWERIDVQPTPVIPEQVQADWNQDDSTQKDYIKNKPDIENIQVEVMPSASAAEADNIYQYISETDANYINGYFYKCVIDPNAEYTGAKLMAVFNDACGENYTNVAIFNDIVSRWSQDKTLKCTFWLAFDPGSSNRTYKCALGPSITFDSSNNNIVFTDTWYRSDNITGSSQSTTWQTINNSGSQPVFNEDYVILDSFNTDYPGFESYKWERIDVQPAPTPYTLPVATESTLGGIKVGNNLNIDNEGVLSAEDQIQSDWNQEDSTKNDFIKNKPFIGMNYINKTGTEIESIADGSNADIYEFDFYSGTENSNVQFFSSLNFEVNTTVNNDVYGDCELTISYLLDGVVVESLVETYGDGKKVLLLNYLLADLPKGNHIFTVNLAVSGGSIS
jgi:hypothetical protein